MHKSIVGVAVAALVSATSGAAMARDFTYAGWGGTLQEAQREVYLKPLAQSGEPFKEDVYLGGVAKFEAMKASKDVVWDVVNVEAGVLQQGCDEGTFLKIDYSKLTTPRSGFTPGTAADCGVGSYVWAWAVAFDANVIKDGPATLGDFWDLTKWPGRRGMRKGPVYNLELAMIADGVPVAEVYKTLATKEGRARALKKLDAIKSQVIWWESPAQTPELLAAGSVAMVVAPNARISAANKGGKNFKMIFKPGMYGADFWVIVAGSPKVDAAYKFLKIGSDPKAQAAFSNVFAYAPTLTAAMPLLPAGVVDQLPIGDAVAGGLDLSSPAAKAFWADNSDRINEEWSTWLAR